MFHACASTFHVSCICNRSGSVHIPNWVLYSQFRRMCCKLFWPIFYTHGTIGYHQYSHFYQWEHLLWLIQYLVLQSSKNVAIAIDTATISKLWLHILNLLKIWGQMIYRPSHLSPVLWNPVLGLEHQNTHSNGKRPDMKMPSLDSDSPLKTGPDDI